MKTSVNHRKQLVGLLFGLTAGFAFAIFAWGIDGFLLARANGAYPWVKFFPGLLICLISGGLVGWLTVRVQNPLVRIILWLLFAFLLSKLFIWLPMKVAPQIIGWFDSNLGGYLEYPVYVEFIQMQWVGFMIIALIAVICSLLENILIDQALFSTGTFSFIVPLIVSFMFFCMAGNVTDGILNKQIRIPIQKVDNLIQFALDNSEKEIPVEVKRSMHLSAVNNIKEYLPLKRRLILSNFDQAFGQIDILVQFNGYWVKCTTIYNQVTFCKLAFDPPKRSFVNLIETQNFAN